MYMYIIITSLLYSRELYCLLKKIDIVLSWKTGVYPCKHKVIDHLSQLVISIH